MRDITWRTIKSSRIRTLRRKETEVTISMPFTQATLDFLFQNWVNNSKEFFEAHREDYRRLVVEPFQALVIALTPGMLKIDERFITEPKIDRTISRIYRNMSIPSNRLKSRYRENCWLVFSRDKQLWGGPPAYYFEINPGGFGYGMGYYQADREALAAIRAMLLAGEPSAKTAMEAFRSQDVFGMYGEPYKRSKYPDQPEELRLWLDRKGIGFQRESADLDLLFSENLADKLLRDFQLLAPIYRLFLDAEARKIHEN